MAEAIQMQLNFRQVPNDPNMFEFVITTPMLRSQFLIPRTIVNQLRVDLEKALINKTEKQG
jgi:hypothetical protein